jgi:hypothetical protein
MLKSFHFPPAAILTAIAISGLSACSPAYDWREVHGPEASYTILLPAKPATHSRKINLNGLRLTMTMTAAQVDGVTFAVGSARLPDGASPPAALHAMKTALVKNISGTIRHDKAVSLAGSSSPAIEIEAVGVQPGTDNAPPRVLFARFAEKDRRIYQAIVVGQQKRVDPDTVETFLTSFKLN